MTTRILALDTALHTGYAYGHADGSNRRCGVWNLRMSTDRQLGQRLWRLHDFILEFQTDGVDLMVYEEAAKGTDFQRTTIFHSQLQAAMEMAAVRLQAETLQINPASLKLHATGNGRADKEEMARAYFTHFEYMPRDDNEADALWLWEMARRGYERPAAKAKRIKRQDKARQSELF